MRGERDWVNAEDLITQIKQGLSRARLERPSSEDREIAMTGVTLRLLVAVNRTGGGGFKLRVPIIGADLAAGIKTGTHSHQTIEVVLRPVPEENGPVAAPPVSASITDAVRTIMGLLVAAEDQEPRWTLDTAKVQLEFGIDSEGLIQ